MRFELLSCLIKRLNAKIQQVIPLDNLFFSSFGSSLEHRCVTHLYSITQLCHWSNFKYVYFILPGSPYL